MGTDRRWSTCHENYRGLHGKETCPRTLMHPSHFPYLIFWMMIKSSRNSCPRGWDRNLQIERPLAKVIGDKYALNIPILFYLIRRLHLMYHIWLFVLSFKSTQNYNDFEPAYSHDFWSQTMFFLLNIYNLFIKEYKGVRLKTSGFEKKFFNARGVSISARFCNKWNIKTSMYNFLSNEKRYI